MTFAKTLRKVRETPSSAREGGCSAQFINLGNGWGLKFYWDAATRNKCKRLQKRAFKAGIAPKAGKAIDFELDGHQKYGYFTRVVDIVWYKILRDNGLDSNSYYRLEHYSTLKRTVLDQENMVKSSTEYGLLMKEMIKIGLKTSDMHNKNIGWDEEGKLVCIDFDLC